jgi:predicted hotdog family 3-hydroxylacyl-ACP dehydratase
MSAMPAPIALMPHKGDAVLLEEISNIDENQLEAGLVERPDTAFGDDAGCLPGLVDPERLAQAITALSGHRSLAAGGRCSTAGSTGSGM